MRGEKMTPSTKNALHCCMLDVAILIFWWNIIWDPALPGKVTTKYVNQNDILKQVHLETGRQ